MKRVRSQTKQKWPRDKVVVRVPATSANLGPGFDAMGMGLDIWNEISVERAATWEITTEGEGAGAIPEVVREDGSSDHMVIKALRRAFEYAGEPMPRVKVHCRNRIPVCSGFGSSSAAIVGGLVAGLALAGTEVRSNHSSSHPEWVPEELLQLATEMEGHPDNVAPSIYGGIQLSVQLSPLSSDGRPRINPQLALSRRVPIPEGLRLVAYVPTEACRFSFASQSKTEEMRALLPGNVPREEAVFNIQRTALLIDCLHRGDLSLLTIATEDVLHQPARSTIYPHLKPMVRAALDAGAHGAFLSGAGPTILAICSGATGGDVFTQSTEERQENDVASAMRKAVESLPVKHDMWKNGKFYICSPCYNGCHVVSASPPMSNAMATFGTLDGDL
eukprot:CAMPEP_0119275924 /NCGR_PEP_ID=MMETSP1329-20130426/14604_1 /TAXON_ID=114041 /ORGANISM="Genus nov. species nov., Strain RCC1024" /LENGTH=388 /DNA_ID=CAMNT_0007276345 /DNA_START=174 /DNA_END=1340 /DNA_ORIENTATION=+